MRKAWERLIESKLFNGVVERFQNDVMTLKIKDVRVTEHDGNLVDSEMTELSPKIHDESEIEMRPELTIGFIQERIEKMENYIQELKNRKDEIENARKS